MVKLAGVGNPVRMVIQIDEPDFSVGFDDRHKVLRCMIIKTIDRVKQDDLAHSLVHRGVRHERLN